LLQDDGDALDQVRLRQQLSFEQSVVLRIVDRFDLRRPLEELHRMCRDATGSPTLTLQWFGIWQPTFPVRLFAKHRGAGNAEADDIAQRFSNTPLYKAYLDVIDLDPDAAEVMPFGIVMSRVVFRGLVVLHTRSAHLDRLGTRLVRIAPKVGTIVIEPFAVFLDALDWHP
jgi:hypothetical protein